MKYRIRATIALAVAASLALSACTSGGGSDTPGGSTTLHIVGFAVPEAGQQGHRRRVGQDP